MHSKISTCFKVVGDNPECPSCKGCSIKHGHYSIKRRPVRHVVSPNKPFEEKLGGLVASEKNLFGDFPKSSGQPVASEEEVTSSKILQRYLCKACKKTFIKNYHNQAYLSCQLASNIIPENWIPFSPVHTGNNNRSMQLQRASMPRILKPYATSLVRPVTSLLRKGLEGSPVQPLFLNEEEVTRAGTIVKTTYQRARWYNGAIVSWVGRRKMTGRGEGSSGLTFDNLT